MQRERKRRECLTSTDLCDMQRILERERERVGGLDALEGRYECLAWWTFPCSFYLILLFWASPSLFILSMVDFLRYF